jgi:hypothetical protein
VAFVTADFGYSERQACKLLEVDRTSYRYAPKPDRNETLCAELIALADPHFEAGYMLAVFLRSVGRRVLQPGPGPYMPPRFPPNEVEKTRFPSGQRPDHPRVPQNEVGKP